MIHLNKHRDYDGKNQLLQNQPSVSKVPHKNLVSINFVS